MGKIYSFTQNQLKVLLSGRGCTSVTGINITTSALENEAVLKSLNELTKARVISSDGETFDMDHSVREIIDCLSTSRTFIALRSNNNRLPDKCLFLSDKVLVCSGRVGDDTRLALGFCDYEDIFCDLDDEGYFKAVESDLAINEEELESFEQELFSSIQPNEPIPEGIPLSLSVDELTEDGELLRYFRIVDYHLYTYVIYYDGESVIRDTYTPQTATNYFKKMISL